MDTAVVLVAIGVSSSILLVVLVVLVFGLRRPPQPAPLPPNAVELPSVMLNKLDAIQYELASLQNMARDQSATKDSI